VPDPEATTVFVGYQAAGTLGRRILDGEPEVKILGQWVPLRCRVAKIGGFSAHADWKEVLQWLEGMESSVPSRTFLTHGEPEAANAMAGHIKDKFGWNVQVPQYGERFEIV
jgi:metallo-beta-lactamase family protein